jgi:thioredoxin reductase (NADPH)
MLRAFHLWWWMMWNLRFSQVAKHYYLIGYSVNDMVERLIIIGAGPAGLTAALYAARAGLEPLVLTGFTVGGQILLSSCVENFPGFPEGVVGSDLADLWQQQAMRFGARCVLTEVTSVDFKSRPLKVSTSKNVYEAEAVIIATGASAKRLGVKSERRLTGRGVSTCATCDAVFFRGKDVVVVGGGDTAMDEALFLSRIVKSVTVVHWRDKLRASKVLQKRALGNEKISFVWNQVVEDIVGENQVEGVVLRDVKTGEKKSVKCQGVFIAIGYQPNTALFKDQVKLNKVGYIHRRKQSETSVKGVFAAGDVNDNRYRQAVTAAGAGCKAAIDAIKYLENQGVI